MKRLFYAVAATGFLGFGSFVLLTAPSIIPSENFDGITSDATAGEAVFWAAGCASCHMAPDATGAEQLVLSGGRKFVTAFGTFVAPNISPDPVAGIGGWSVTSFSNAVRGGVSPQGQHLFPSLPYTAYNKMTVQDLADLKAFMDGLPPSALASLPHQVGFPFNIRRSLGIWKRLFRTSDWVVTGDLTATQTRGRYIVEALAHCGECHTPRNPLGGLQRGDWLGGGVSPDGKNRIPNITPAKLTWSEPEIVEYLTSGFTPDFDTVGGEMVHVVGNMARLPESDRQAVAAYLKIVPAVMP